MVPGVRAQLALLVLATASGALSGRAPAAAETYVSGGLSRVCPRGSYCTAGVKRPCPVGSFQDAFGQAQCKPCPAGRVCPAGSAAPLAAGRTSAPPAPAEPPSADSSSGSSWSSASGSEAPQPPSCGAGFRAAGGSCALCPAGSYCPGDGQVLPCPGDSRAFCPAGSSSALLVKAGRYVDGAQQREMVCERGYWVDAQAVRRPCGAGTFGARAGETEPGCSGQCEAGFWCPAGSVSARERACTDASTFCPVGAGAPQAVAPGFYSSEDRSAQLVCPVGYYCSGGVRYACPAGSVNADREGLSARAQCARCPAGSVCLGGSVRACGGASRFCPGGDPFSPRVAAEGEYTVGGAGGALSVRTTQSECSASGTAPCQLVAPSAWYFAQVNVQDDAERRVQALPCPPGHYCSGGERRECAPGRFGAAARLSAAECSGLCAAGFYCPAASTSARQLPCPAPHSFCPEGSGSPSAVRAGYYVSADRSREMPCEPGTYCVGGVRRACAAGKFGSATALASPECSGLCPAGHFCPERAAAPRACADAASYCPPGSASPLPVLPGFWSTEDRAWQLECPPGSYCERGLRRLCPAGVFGAAARLAGPACSGPCPAGHFCLEGSVRGTARGCSAALGRTAEDTAFQANDLADLSCLVNLLDVYPEQFFEFSLLPERTEMDPYQWNLAQARLGRYPVDNTLRWNASERAFRAQGANTSEALRTGWRPGSGPKTMCMWKMMLSDSGVGLDGMQKVEADNDYFMMGTLWSYTDRVFVASGADRGGYADIVTPINPAEWVFYCLASGGAGSTSEAYVATPRQNVTRVWNGTNGADRGIVAPLPLSMIYGRTSQPQGAQDPQDPLRGDAHTDALYGGILHWDAHLTQDQLTNAFDVTSDFYYGPEARNEEGVRRTARLRCGAYASQEWAQGFNARNVGPLPAAHLEKDRNARYRPVTERVRQAGAQVGLYHLTSTPLRQFQRPDFDVPMLPAVLGATPRALYCPEGSAVPNVADEGYYTATDDAWAQTKCEPGSYCTLGVKRPCPPGTYGAEPGLVSPKCTATCPAGHKCPEGADAPTPCEPGAYAPPASDHCVACNAPREIPCQTSRDCCSWLGAASS